MTDMQLGRFTVLADWIRRDPAMVAQVFAAMECVVLRAEMMYAEKHIAYAAISPRFRPLAIGEMIPEYEILCTDGPDGKLTSVTVKERPHA